jgi:bacillithiol system protein YtxJ
MNWKHLTTVSQLDDLVKESSSNPVLIFKHSTSCSISSTALNRLERNWNIDERVAVYLLDLLSYRKISIAIEDKFGVAHESPQVLIIEKGNAIFDRSHFDINFRDIESKLLAEGNITN